MPILQENSTNAAIGIAIAPVFNLSFGRSDTALDRWRASGSLPAIEGFPVKSKILTGWRDRIEEIGIFAKILMQL